MQNLAQNEPVRIDKWLWAARFFKTRALATEAVNGGKVHVDGIRVKPGKKIQAGMEIRITQGWNVRTVMVNLVSERRGPASVAQTLYTETVASIQQNEEEAARRKASMTAPAPTRKPDKRQRRQIIKFREH